MPLPSGVSTLRPGRFPFFGRGDSQIVQQNFILSMELFQGDAGYRPKDWSIKATLVANGNYLHAEEKNVVNVSPARGRDRTRRGPRRCTQGSLACPRLRRSQPRSAAARSASSSPTSAAIWP